MNDVDKIQNGASLTLYDELIQDRPENVLRRVSALGKSAADMFENAIGVERMEKLTAKVTSNSIAESIETIPDDKLTANDLSDLRATDY